MMNKKVISAAILAGIAAFTFIIMAVISGRLFSMRTEAVSLAAAYADMAKNTAFYDAQNARMEHAIASLPKHRAANDEKGAVITAIVSRVSQSGMKLLSLNPGDAANGSFPLEIHASGRFAQALAVLSAVERLPFIITEDAVEMSSSPDGIELTMRLTAVLK